MSARKIVICGAGFLGSYVARELGKNPRNIIHLASRDARKKYTQLKNEAPFAAASSTSNPPPNSSQTPTAPKVSGAQSDATENGRLGDPLTIDITSESDIHKALEGAHAVVSLVGILHGSPEKFDQIQYKGNEKVFKVAKDVGARVVHVSAIGANTESVLPYFRTKALAEQALFDLIPEATVIRPSLLFGPGDGFFARFATLSKFLPFLPVFGGGTTNFQPVFAGDLARFIAICVDAEAGSKTLDDVGGKIFETGGPDVFTYREMMQLVLQYTNRTRPVISLPWTVGKVQGWALEKLPENILTLTRDQVEQLKMDNVAYPSALPGSQYAGKPPPTSAVTGLPGFADVLEKYSERGPTSVHDVLGSYLG